MLLYFFFLSAQPSGGPLLSVELMMKHSKETQKGNTLTWKSRKQNERKPSHLHILLFLTSLCLSDASHLGGVNAVCCFQKPGYFFHVSANNSWASGFYVCRDTNTYTSYPEYEHNLRWSSEPVHVNKCSRRAPQKWKVRRVRASKGFLTVFGEVAETSFMVNTSFHKGFFPRYIKCDSKGLSCGDFTCLSSIGTVFYFCSYFCVYASKIPKTAVPFF